MKEFRQASIEPTASRNVSPASFRAAVATKPQAAAASAATRSWLQSPAAGGLPGHASDSDAASRLTPLSRIGAASVSAKRTSTGSDELDRLFGGGIVPGSVTLLGGAPGAGKSTLLMQLAALLAHGTYEQGGAAGGWTDGARPSGFDADTRVSGIPYSDFFRGRMHAGRRSRVHPSGHADGPPPAPPRYVAYVSGEESASQLHGRSSRLGIAAPGLLVLNETRVESILEQLQDAVAAAGTTTTMSADGAAQTTDGAANGDESPSRIGSAIAPSGLAAVIVDSIQTVFSDSLPGAAGSVTQVRECAVRLTQWAKATGVPVMLVGHITKAGDIGGPRTLEHLVDAVLFMEGEEAVSASYSGSGSGGGGGYDNGYGGGGGLGSSGGARLVRAIKNRFGSTAEVGIFRMTDAGFVESSPARLFLSRPLAAAAGAGSDGEASDREDSDANGRPAPSGCAVTVTVEGSRPLCAEVQALATARYSAFPRHRSMGIPPDRLFMLAAVLSRHTPLRPRPSDTDLLVNVVGGLRISDPAADLAIAVAVASTLLGRPAPPGAIFLGEIGLGGEIRPSPSGGASTMTRRLRAAAGLGFHTAYVPMGTFLPPSAPSSSSKDASDGSGHGQSSGDREHAEGAAPALRLVHVRSISDVIHRAFGAHPAGLGASKAGAWRRGVAATSGAPQPTPLQAGSANSTVGSAYKRPFNGGHQSIVDPEEGLDNSGEFVPSFLPNTASGL